MRFWGHSQKNGTTDDGARGKVGIEYSAVTIAADQEGNGYHLEFYLTLDAAVKSATGPLLLALNNCPLVVRDVSSGASMGSRVVSSAGREHILLEPEPGLGWDKQVVRLLTFWQPVSDPARSPQVPWAIVPDMLPTPVLVENPNVLRASVHQPIITFARELPSELGGGGISLARDAANEPTSELLQSVIFPRVLLRDSLDDDRFAFVSTGSVPNPELRATRTLLAEMMEFLAGTLRVDPAARMCIALTDDPFNVVVAPGALLPLRADWLGLGADEHRYEHLIVRMLTGVWWGSGCRIRGEDSLPIYIAIGGAMGLLWLESGGAGNAVERILAKHRTVSQGKTDGATIGTFQVSALTIAFYDALRDPHVASEFGRLTRECWAQTLDETIWLQRLNECGIVLPNILTGA